MSKRDEHIHSPKDIMTFGIFGAYPFKTTSTACGKRRLAEYVSLDPAMVDCLACRKAAARYHRETAGTIQAVISLPGWEGDHERMQEALTYHNETAADFERKIEAVWQRDNEAADRLLRAILGEPEKESDE